MLHLLDNAFGIVANVMHYVLIGTIVLGVIIALVFLVMLAKKLHYNKQMRENKKQREKIIKNEVTEDEETP